MLSAKSITPNEINKLGVTRQITRLLFSVCFFLLPFIVSAQDNSPFSRYGLGDLTPPTNIVNRGMGGISAAYASPISVNFNNPASYSNFFVFMDERTKEVSSGRVVLDVGLNFENRTLREPNETEKFTSSNALFSYVQVGIPIRRNWGLSFGLRPISRVSYKIGTRGAIYDGTTGEFIDSAITEYSGNGGAFLPSIGTGVAFGNFSIGASVGYLFGRKENSTRLAPFNDSISYTSSNHQDQTYFGDLFLMGGAQYRIKLGSGSNLVLGLSGNMKHDLNASRDRIVETFVRDPINGDIRIDSVHEERDISGTVVYPASFTGGIMYERQLTSRTPGLVIGVDYAATKWSEYRIHGATDAVQDNWQIRAGAQVTPVPGRNYFSMVEYRAGFFVGRDYISADGDLPVYGITAGLGLPLRNVSPLSRGQITRINLALEYNSRGNNSNVLKDNVFRISVGLNLSDLWFGKRKYE